MGEIVLIGSSQPNVKNCLKHISQKSALAFCTSRSNSRMNPRRNSRTLPIQIPRINNYNSNSGYYVRNERAFDISAQEFVTILFQGRNGKYTTKSERYGSINSYERFQDLAKLSGCGTNSKFCVGDQAFLVSSKEYVHIIAIHSNGKYVTKGSKYGSINTFERNIDLAKTSGCLNNYYPCVGAKAYDKSAREDVEIIGIMNNGKFVTKGSRYGSIKTYERLDYDFYVY